MLKARGVGGSGGAGLEDLLHRGGDLVEVGVVVVQPAGDCDKWVGKVGGVEKQCADGRVLVRDCQVVVQVQALGGGLQCEMLFGVCVSDNGGKLLVLGHGGV